MPVEGGLLCHGGPDTLGLRSPYPLRSRTWPAAPRTCTQASTRASPSRTSPPAATPPCGRAADPHPPAGHRRRLARLVPEVRGTGGGPGRPQRPRPAVTHLPADRRHRGRADDLPARGEPEESATGTTATPGYATPPSPWTPCGSPPAPARRSSSSAGWPRPPQATRTTTTTSRSCSASAANATWANANCPTCPAGATAAPSAPATAPGPSASPTSTANCSPPSTSCATTCTTPTNTPEPF